MFADERDKDAQRTRELEEERNERKLAIALVEEWWCPGAQPTTASRRVAMEEKMRDKYPLRSKTMMESFLRKKPSLQKLCSFYDEREKHIESKYSDKAEDIERERQANPWGGYRGQLAREAQKRYQERYPHVDFAVQPPADVLQGTLRGNLDEKDDKRGKPLLSLE